MCSVSLITFFLKPYKTTTEELKMYNNDGIAMVKIKSKLKLTFLFEETRVGLVVVTVYEATGLRNVDPMGQQDPYVQLSLGSTYKKRTRSIKNGGSRPYFAEEEVMMWLDNESWVNNLQIEMFDEDMGLNKPIGGTSLSLLPYCDIKLMGKEEVFTLYHKVETNPNDRSASGDKAEGEIIMKIKHYPAGKLNVFVDRARSLKFPETYAIGAAADGKRLDPYVSLSLDGKAIKTIKRTPADKDGGAAPTFGSNIEFDIVDQYLLDVEVFHQNIQGADVLLGVAQVSLLPAFRTGESTSWTCIKVKNAAGTLVEEGEIQLRISFDGPVAVAFPQLRPDISSFTDTDRKAMALQDKLEKIKQGIFDKDIKTEMAEKELEITPAMDDNPAEFSEAEIIAAFKFIDLDHNNYVGAKEIRHILVCMGELITDEEVDMMVSMVDMDGDGQVGFIRVMIMMIMMMMVMMMIMMMLIIIMMVMMMMKMFSSVKFQQGSEL
jgi:hypothetical protein